MVGMSTIMQVSSLALIKKKKKLWLVQTPQEHSHDRMRMKAQQDGKMRKMFQSEMK